jgi:hypothetical protein
MASLPTANSKLGVTFSNPVADLNYINPCDGSVLSNLVHRLLALSDTELVTGVLNEEHCLGRASSNTVAARCYVSVIILSFGQI